MAVCLDSQSVYCRRDKIVISVRLQLLAATLLLIALVVKIWVKIETTDLGYQLAKERNKTVSLDMERRELELQLSVILRPDNLTKKASQTLGFVPLDANRARKVRY